MGFDASRLESNRDTRIFSKIENQRLGWRG